MILQKYIEHSIRNFLDREYVSEFIRDKIEKHLIEIFSDKDPKTRQWDSIVGSTPYHRTLERIIRDLKRDEINYIVKKQVSEIIDREAILDNLVKRLKKKQL